MPYKPGTHASDEVLEQYSLGKLPEREVETFEEHLLICPACQDRLGEMDRYVRVTRSALEEVEAAPAPYGGDSVAGAVRRLLHPGPVLAIAATAALAIVLLPRISAPPLSPAAAVAVTLEATRGAPGGPAPAATPLLLRLDAAGLEGSAYAVEIVDAAGAPVLEAAARREQNHIVITGARTFAAGTYWVRVYGDEHELLREYGLRISKDAPR
jgi:hypothetical protein